MRKKDLMRSAGIGIAVCCLACGAHAAPQETERDWNASDALLFKKLKAQSGQSDAEIYQRLGFSYFKKENFDRAFLYFHAAVRANPKLAWSWYYLGLLNLQDGEEYFRKAIEADRRFVPAYYWLGRTCQKSGKTAEAISAYEDYLRLAKDVPQERQRARDVQGMVAELRATMPPDREKRR